VKFFLRWLSTLFLVVVTGFIGWSTGLAWSQSPLPAKSRPAIYDFGSGRCLSCRQMEKILEAVKGQYGEQVEVRLIYVDQDTDLARRYKIMLIPTQVLVDASGQEVFRHLGLSPKDELVKKLQELNFIKK
jgi:thioredoxin 1